MALDIQSGYGTAFKTFNEFIAALGNGLGVTIETEGDVAAISTGPEDGPAVTILLHGFDERNSVLMTADLGLPPPERLERLYRALLEANDLFRDTAGATLSVDPGTGRVRLQRHDTYDALVESGPDKAFLAFADVADAWAQIVRDYRDAPEEKAEKPQDLGNLSGFRA